MSPPAPIPANAQIPIILARDPGVVATLVDIVRPAIAVTADHSSWDDFSYYLSAHLFVLLPDQAPAAIGMHFMIEGVHRTEHFFAQRLATQPWIPIEQVQERYCAILNEAGSYQRIIDLLGFELAITTLRQLGDAVVLRLENADTTRLPLFETEQFHLGALRSNSSYVAFRQGHRYLRPHRRAQVSDAAMSFRISTDLISANNPYEIEFDFQADELNRDRVVVLIGRNGTGKTQMLLRLIETQRSGQGVEAALPILEPIPLFNRLLVFSSVASDSYPRSIPPWDGVDYQYFSMIGTADAERDALTGALIDCIRDDRRVHFLSGGGPFVETGRLELLRQALASLSLSSAIHLPLKIQSNAYDFPDTRPWNGREYFPLFRTLNEQRQLLLVRAIDWSQSPVAFGLGEAPRTLSSGELAMLRFAAQATGSIEQGCLLLFDEPETHLHPNFVSEFMSILHTMLAATKSAAIIVTHSAYVVREVPRQRVRIFTLDDRTISIDQPRLQTFGASIDSISQFVFGDSNISHQYLDVLQDWVGRLGPDVTIERIVEKYGETLNPETLSYVAHLLRTRLQ